MKDDTSGVSAFEAKTHLSELLRETERGKSFIIRRRGKVVARLVPPVTEPRCVNLRKVLAEFRAFRKGLSGTFNVKELIQEGRRY